MTNSKIGIVLAIIVVVLGGFWIFGSKKTANDATKQSAVDSQAAVVTVPPVDPTLADVSDTGIETNLSSVDSGLNNLGSDNANLDQGLNDKPIPQTE